jgi:hypothetical protein
MIHKRQWSRRLVALAGLICAALVASASPAAAAVRMGPVTDYPLPASIRLHLVAAREGGAVQGECGLHQGTRSRKMVTCQLENLTNGDSASTRTISPRGFQGGSVVVGGRSANLTFHCGHRYQVVSLNEVSGFGLVLGVSNTYRLACA